MVEEHEIPWAPLRRLFKKAGADIVEKEAIKEFSKWLEDKILDIADNAIRLMKNQNRKTLYTKDLKLAIRFMERS